MSPKRKLLFRNMSVMQRGNIQQRWIFNFGHLLLVYFPDKLAQVPDLLRADPGGGAQRPGLRLLRATHLPCGQQHEHHRVLREGHEGDLRGRLLPPGALPEPAGGTGRPAAAVALALERP